MRLDKQDQLLDEILAIIDDHQFSVGIDVEAVKRAVRYYFDKAAEGDEEFAQEFELLNADCRDEPAKKLFRRDDRDDDGDDRSDFVPPVAHLFTAGSASAFAY